MQGEPLLTPTEMGRADALTIAGGMPGERLMENAGYAVADVICARFNQGTRAIVLCGMGNNGGDGFVIARVLKQRGFAVRVALALPEGMTARDLKGDAAGAERAWRGETLPATADLFEGAKVIVDALYGAGLSRDVSGRDAELIAAVNMARANGASVYAVDLPSGIDGRTGEVRGTAILADETVTFFRRKPGHLLLPGRTHCGRVRLAQIGIDPRVLAEIAPETVANGPSLWAECWPEAAIDSHKYSRGAALVASGPLTSCGAARLAAEAALRAGAGIVTVATPPAAMATVAAWRAAFVVRPAADMSELAGLLREPRLRAAVLGPGLGLGDDVWSAIRGALEGHMALVLDADAITQAARRPDEAFALIKARDGGVVLTPHEGEFGRLFPDIGGSKLDRARAAAERSGAVVLLKGPDTVIAHPDGRAAINENGTAALATAGSGDVLAGIIGGLLAARRPAFEATALAAWMHGEAGRIAGPGSLADEIAFALRGVLAAGRPAATAPFEGDGDDDVVATD
ncbi:Bifunctional NAD(P)H-hydrate repair enzyme Nnr [Pleomorphomonas sp. T1.2MG-36]|uniref:NAD(P)H-hydrate dehydratase n=1 Tax=Pleomorphomonas sp. T1.2MG-36 TaxID=3041167 RepID=UPI0024774431|nr:NAD(P)H-hydrate dehydratase [Pleomorphomonas sp. T1.2MG-36]CAI9409466.1 Bifunctional NAD(P)H-hydrate repair enzyme Nnr [Pleomorphomonas sp. T1.2MG-36]